MSKNKWAKYLDDIEGAVVDDYNPYANVIRTPSPSVNFAFGNTQGLPLGYTLVLYGPPKGGKSVLCNAMIGQLHKDDPEAIAVKWNTELRERGQTTPAQRKLYGIDEERYRAYENNSASLFDDFVNKVGGMCEKGAPVKLVIIDSISSIVGRRDANAESIDVQQIGDHAKTIGDGLKRILKTQRKHNIALVLTAQVRAELDQLEIKRGNKVKMAAAWALQHYAEYFMYIEPNRNKDGRQDISGNDLRDESLKDMRNDSKYGEQTGHKIRVCMKDSSVSPKGRVGEFTLDYNRGIINTHEEVFTLGCARGIIQRPNALSYVYKDSKWTGKPAMVEALRMDTELCNHIITDLREMDISGKFSVQDAEDGKLVSAADLENITDSAE